MFIILKTTVIFVYYYHFVPIYYFYKKIDCYNPYYTNAKHVTFPRVVSQYCSAYIEYEKSPTAHITSNFSPLNANSVAFLTNLFDIDISDTID